MSNSLIVTRGSFMRTGFISMRYIKEISQVSLSIAYSEASTN